MGGESEGGGSWDGAEERPSQVWFRARGQKAERVRKWLLTQTHGEKDGQERGRESGRGKDPETRMLTRGETEALGS